MIQIILLSACHSVKNKDTLTGDTADTAFVDNLAICEDLTPVSCEDDLILDLGLQDSVSDGNVSTTNDGGDFLTYVDATAGGYQNSASNPWVYVKFTHQGAEKVEISDEDALQSANWDMSLKRFLIRLNGGSSGPSCVGSAVFFEQSYETLTEAPQGVSYVLDNYYTTDCSIINDSSGLPNSPQTAMSPWWEYPGCVATTGHPFIIQLANGELIKLVVEAYYAENQDECNSTGAMGSGSANFTMRWQYLDL
ncbi:MAG: HmuY family protein [Myxococcota bacterium]